MSAELSSFFLGAPAAWDIYREICYRDREITIAWDFIKVNTTNHSERRAAGLEELGAGLQQP